MLSALFARLMASQRFRMIAGYIGIAVAVLAALWLAKTFYDRALIADHDAAQETAVLKADAVADDVAGQITASEAATIQQENERARQNANAGSDPLGDGLRSLRKRTHSDR